MSIASELMPSEDEVSDAKVSQPQNQSKKYEHLFTNIDSGQMKIPVFQRDFVWTTTQTARLIDNIIKGYPIGTFIFWKTREELRRVRNIGNVPLPDIPVSVYKLLNGSILELARDYARAEIFQVEQPGQVTLVDDYLNKRKIGARAPSIYMRDFHGNHRLAETMRTHLIDDLDGYGIWTDDYFRFVEMRGQRVLAELKERLEPDLT